MIKSILNQGQTINLARLPRSLHGCIKLSTHCAIAALLLGSIAQAQPPKYDEAFADGYFWYAQGRVEAARQKWEKLLKLQPDNREVKAALAELKQFDPAKVREDLIEQARELARKHRYQDAIEVYRSAFGGPPPTSFYALEYYETLSGAKAGWPEAIEHLRKLADTYPSNPAFRLTLAKVLSYREQTRREAIQKLSELATTDSLPQAQRQEAQQSWRQALLWLNATLDDKPLYDAYLKVDSDPVVAQTLANIDQPGGKIGEAYALLEQRHTEQARKRFREILANDPENAEAIAGLGIIELRQHRFSKAQRLLEQSIHQDPEKRHTLGRALRDARYWSLVHRGRRAFTRRQFDKAAALARRAARLEPGRIEPTLLKASIENARGRYQKSLDLYKKVLKKRPRNLEARQGVVQNYLALKDDISARSAIHRYKLPSRAYQQALTRIQVENLRRDAALLGNDPNAIEILQDALDLTPDDPWIRLDLARLYHRLGREDEALSLFDNLLKARPGQADIFYAKALYHEENKQWREGLLAMQAIPGDEMDAGKRALKRHLWAYNEQRKALELIAAGDTKQARLIAQKIKSVSRLNDPETALPYAELLAALGDEREALRIGRQFVDPIFSPDIDTRISFGNLLLKTGHRQELASLLERIETRSGISLNMRQQRAIDRLKDGARLQQADVEKLAGQYDQALQTLASPPLVADNRQAFTQLRASIEMAHGQHRQAIKTYQSILDQDPGNEQAWAGAASAALAADDKPLASQFIDQGLQHRPRAPRLLSLRSQLNQLKGQQGAASHDLELALGDPNETFDTPAETPEWLASARQRKARIDDATRSRLSIGLGSRDRGNSGLDQVTEYSLPLELDYRLPNKQRIGFNLRNVILDGPENLKSVEQKSRDFNLAYFGGLPIFLSNPKNFDPDLNADGLAFNLHYRNDNWLIDAGSKPSGFLGDSLVGGVKWQGQTFTRKYSIEYDQRAIKESVLAYAGAHDPQFDRDWGGVVRSGVNLSYDQQIRRRFGFYTHLGFHNLSGKNVANNDEKGFQLGGYWQLDRQANRSLSLGLGLQYRKFDKNLRFFTLGHGGYFSPQRYLALTLPLEYFRQMGRLTYHVNLSPGLFTLEESSAPLFPNDPALQDRWEELASSRDKLDPTYKSRSNSGFLYNVQADLGFRLDNQFTLTGWLDANNTTDFNEFAVGVGLTYFFTPAVAPTDKLQDRERTGLHEIW